MKTQTETERKFILRMPEKNALRAMADCEESEIRQTYLSAPDGVTHRVRARTTDGRTVYTETVKIRLSRASCRETEGEITKERYEALKKEILPGTRTVEKTRVTFPYGGHLFECDLYPEWTKTCILEIELQTEDEEILFPDGIEILREVTGNKAYSNASMAKAMPEEEQ